MQCVYETVLRYQLKQRNVPYLTWLGDALYRTAKSIAYTNDKPIIGALFTGRRTGGLLFLVLQNYMYSKYQTKTLGSSSSDSLYILNKKLNIETKTVPAGTHAHELSMTISALFPELDYQLPGTTQLIGHYLYWKETMGYAGYKGPPPPIPALPDTIGTGVFLIASKLVAIKDNDAKNPDTTPTPFFNKISAFRQDSGTMEHFKNLITKFDYKGSIMASEIEDTESIDKAIELKYGTFGAGGFYGDSAKAWIPKEIKKDKIIPDNSMAVKVRRVLNCSDDYSLVKLKNIDTKINYFKVCNNNDITSLLNNYNSKDVEDISKFPIKTGDKLSEEEACKSSSKLAIDKNMSPETQALKIALAQGYQNNSLFVINYQNKDKIKIENFKFTLDIENFEFKIENMGGKRHCTRKNQYIKETRRKRNKNCSMKKPKSKKPKSKKPKTRKRRNVQKM
jgi:hypothetical protein